MLEIFKCSVLQGMPNEDIAFLRKAKLKKSRIIFCESLSFALPSYFMFPMRNMPQGPNVQPEESDDCAAPISSLSELLRVKKEQRKIQLRRCFANGVIDDQLGIRVPDMKMVKVSFFARGTWRNKREK